MSLLRLCKKTGGMVNTRNTIKRTMAGRPVNLQLDYFMSTQFAGGSSLIYISHTIIFSSLSFHHHYHPSGVAVAESKGFYRTMNINLELLPTVDVGLEAASVRQCYDAKARKELVMGTCEQNILIPVFLNDATLKLKAVAAMFGRTPLCIAAKVYNSRLFSLSSHHVSPIADHHIITWHGHRRAHSAKERRYVWVLTKTQWHCFKYCCRLLPWSVPREKTSCRC